MRDLDQRTQDLLEEIETNSEGYRSKVKKLSREERRKQLCRIQELFQKSKEYSDDKVQIAMQMYEMVDKHIRRLDADLSRFEMELQLKDPSGRSASVASLSDLQTPPQPLKSRKRGLDSVGGGARKKKASISDEPGPSGIGSPATLTSGTTDVLDMPVDPNEPTYCLCHQVSFGEMIGCDNADCPIEWFHFQCVGLAAKPKGKWYCPRCSQERDKSKKKY